MKNEIQEHLLLVQNSAVRDRTVGRLKLMNRDSATVFLETEVILCRTLPKPTGCT